MWSSSKNRLLDPITFISNHSSIHSAGRSPMSVFGNRPLRFSLRQLHVREYEFSPEARGDA